MLYRKVVHKSFVYGMLFTSFFFMALVMPRKITEKPPDTTRLYKKDVSLKYLILIAVICFSCLCVAEEKFEIPRSVIAEITDSSTKRVYPLFIKTPRSYTAKPDKKYPVIYLTDAWYSFQIASGATRFPMNSGAMEEAILVGISYSKGSRGSSSRVRDYTPVKAVDWKMDTGEAETHAKFIRDMIIPYIDAKYRTKGSQRTFVGNSLGGLFGAHILFNHPDMFSSYVLGSPSVWYAENHILSVPIKTPASQISVYLSVGGLETKEAGEREAMVSGAKKLADKIVKESKKIALQFSIIEGARHETAFPTTLIQGLDSIYRINK